jgi:hypothetical protein
MITPTARSSTLPRAMKVLNSWSMVMAPVLPEQIGRSSLAPLATGQAAGAVLLA